MTLLIRSIAFVMTRDIKVPVKESALEIIRVDGGKLLQNFLDLENDSSCSFLNFSADLVEKCSFTHFVH